MRKVVSLLPLALLLSACDNPIRPNLGQTPNAAAATPTTTELTGVHVVLTYTDRDFGLPPLPPSATGAAYWIEGTLRAPTANPRAPAAIALGRIEDEKTVYAIAPGTYDVAVGYGPSNNKLQLPRGESVQVQANQTTLVTVELGAVLGVIAGALTLNQAPPGDGLVLCTYSGTSLRTGQRLLWCTPLAADGGFRQLLPAGEGRGLVCVATAVDAQMGCPDPASTTATIASFTYGVVAGHTIVLPPLNMGTAGVHVVLTYTDRDLGLPPSPPSGTGAAYWIEGALRSPTADPRAPSPSSTALGRIEDEKTVYAIAPGTYDVAVGYGPSNNKLQLPRSESVQVQANQTTLVTVELGAVLGVIAGALTLNQAPPGDGLVLCTYSGTSLRTGQRLLWCTPLAADGGFRQLLPAGEGRGLVCVAAAVDAQMGCLDPARATATATIASFTYAVEAGRTIVLPPLNVGTAGVHVMLTYTDRDLDLGPLPPSATGAAYWIEGALRPPTANPRTPSTALGRIEDEKTVHAIAPGTYDVAVGYGPPTTTAYFNYPLQLPRGVSVDVRANETTPVTVELGEVLGVIAGAVTLNQAPPGDGFVLCTYIEMSRTPRRLLWCTPLAADGGFRQLLPAGDGLGLLCFAAAVDELLGCPDPARTTATIASFTYGVEAGRTIVLPPLNVGGAATQLAFTVQPSTTTAGAMISPAVRVAARDAFGNTFTGFGGAVTLRLGGAPGSTLSGTTTIAAVAGVATFSDLHIDRAGSGYTLAATAAGLTMATSTSFEIVPGAATQLAFTVQPSATPDGATITPAVQVTAQDAFGNTSTGFGGEVTVGLPSKGNLPAKLGGTRTMAAVAGAATFSDLVITGAVASGYTLTATAEGLTAATSEPFDIVAAAVATQLAFTVQPSATADGGTISPAVQVTAQDAFGNRATGFGGEVTVGLPSKGNLPAKLGGTTAAFAVNGVATFSDLVITGAVASGYTLTATAEGLAEATSEPFAILAVVPTQLTFTVQPSSTPDGGTISPAVQVTAQDAFGNRATGFSGEVTVGLPPKGSTQVELGGTTTVAAVAGVATFSNLVITGAVAGGYTLTATAEGLKAATSEPFDITAP